MKAITLALSFLLFSQLSLALPCLDADVSDAALTAKVDAIASELESNNHEQKIMNMAYNRARVVRKMLNRYLDRVGGLEDATDEDILPLLEDIKTQLTALDHKKIVLLIVNKHLDKTLEKLMDNRTVPTEIAILTINGADPINIGTIFFGSESNVQLTITNEGNGVAQVTGETGMAYPFAFRDGVYPGRNATCGEFIQSGESCTIVIQFQANEIGTFADEMELQYFDGVNNQVLTKGVTGQAI